MKRLTIFLTLLLATTGLSADKIIDVDTGGTGDYDSIEAALSGEHTDITASGYDNFRFQCRSSDGALDEVNEIYIPDYNTTSSQRLYIECVGANRPDFNGMDTSKYRVASNSAFDSTFRAGGYVVFDGIQFDNNNATGRMGVWVRDAGEVIIKNCYFDGGDKDSSTAVKIYRYKTVELYNCIIHGYEYGIQIDCADELSESRDIYNTTIVGCDNGILIDGSDTDTADVEIKNLIIQDSSVADYNTPDGTVSTTAHIYTSDATSPNDATFENVNFAFVDEPNDDYHLDSSMDGLYEGEDLSGTFTEDIDGDTRNDWDVGADELTGGGGGGGDDTQGNNPIFGENSIFNGVILGN